MRHLSHSYISHTQVLRWRERERVYCGRWATILVVVGLHCLRQILYQGSFAGFSPLRFPRGKYFCSLVLLHLSFFQWSFAYGYDVIMINVFRSDITIKNIAWYQRYPKIILCASETLLKLQLLNIRVSWLKTLEEKNL